MTKLLMEPALSLPSLLSTELLGPEEEVEDDDNVDFTPMARRRESGRLGNAIQPNDDGDLYENQKDEEDIFGDDPPSMTLREILLNADASHFHLLGSSILL